MLNRLKLSIFALLSMFGLVVQAREVQVTKVKSGRDLITTIKSPRLLSVLEVEEILIKRADKDDALMVNLLQRIDKGEIFEVHRKGFEVQTMSFDKQ